MMCCAEAWQCKHAPVLKLTATSSQKQMSTAKSRYCSTHG